MKMKKKKTWWRWWQNPWWSLFSCFIIRSFHYIKQSQVQRDQESHKSLTSRIYFCMYAVSQTWRWAYQNNTTDVDGAKISGTCRQQAQLANKVFMKLLWPTAYIKKGGGGGEAWKWPQIHLHKLFYVEEKGS